MNLITSHNLIVPKYLTMVKSKGSKNPKTRVRAKWVRAKVNTSPQPK